MTKRDTRTERFDKLVRDRIPEIIEENDETPIVSTAAGEEYTERLVEKLQEEVAEYAESREVEELADVLEVVHALRADTVGRNFVESRVTFSRSTVRIQPGECHDVTQSYVRQYEHGVSAERLAEMREEKAAERGRFADGIVLDAVESPADTIGEDSFT